VFFHADALPVEGIWWTRTLDEVDNLYLVLTVRPLQAPSGKPLVFGEHSTDLARIDILINYGGIYLDSDILVLKSFDPLLRHNYVMGRVTPDQINSGIVLSRRGEAFLSLWLESYKSYKGKGETYTHKATIVPHKLAELYPHLIHVEEESLNKPNWKPEGMRQLYTGHYNWSDNYAIHLWHRYLPSGVSVPKKPEDIEHLNSTLGEVIRFILYGSDNITLY